MTLIDKTTFDTMVRLIEPHMRDSNARQQHIQVIFTGTDDDLPRIDYSGDSMTVTERIIFALVDYGKRALWRLLKLRLYDLVGYEQKTLIDAWESLLKTDDVTLHGDIPQPEKPTQNTNINIGGSVSGGIVNIGGNQTFEGDVLITQNTVQKIRACPTAPKPPAHFSGRREELDRLRQTLSQGTSVAITGIQGMGGIGKTVLAQQLAHEMTDFSAVLWASLGQQPTAVNILSTWARHADPDFDPGQDDIDTLTYRVQALLTNLINEKCPGQVLIILDDIWEGSVGTARLLQKAAPANSVSLITTRSQKVVAQLRSTRLELKPMQPQEALLMLRKLLADYSTIPDDTLIKLAKMVGFHPLAMELAAGQVTLLERPVQEIDNFITELERGIPAGSPFRDIHLELGETREDNLELVLSFSYNSLTEAEQTDFRQLGILAYGSPFDSGICKAIWESEPKPALDALRHRAMLSIAEDVGWYQQHSLLRAYARALLIQNGETITIFRLYAQHMTRVAYFFREKDNKPEEWGILDPYLLHIHQVGDELVKLYEVDSYAWDELVVEFAYNIGRYLVRRPEALFEKIAGNRQPLRLNWLEMGLTASRQQENRGREGLFLGVLGVIHDNFGNKQQALDYYLPSLAIDRELDNKQNEATTLSNIGLVYSVLGDKAQALDYYQQALPTSQQVGDKSGEATTLNNIGVVYSALGDKAKALDTYQQALPIRRQVGDKSGEATTLSNIGVVYNALGDKAQALDFYQQALPIQRQVGDKSGEAVTCFNMGLLYDALGDKQQALSYYQQALPISQQVGDKAGEAVTCFNMGLLYDALGDKQQALSYFQQALPISQQVGDKSGEATTLNNIGLVYDDLEDYDKAINYYQQALPILRQVGNKSSEAVTCFNIGMVYEALGKLDEAIRYVKRCVTLDEQIQHPDLENDRHYLAWLKRKRDTSP